MQSNGDRDSESDSESIHDALQGSLDAFNHVVLKYQGRLYNHAYALMGNRQAAEDATQEGITKAFQKLSQFRGGSFRSWLFKIVTNTCYDELRRLKHYPETVLCPEDENGDEIDSALWLVDPGISVMLLVEQREFLQALHRHLRELSEIERGVITLIDLNEFGYSEAAGILNIPLGTVKSRLVRARCKMKGMFQMNLDPSDAPAVHETQLVGSPSSLAY